MSGEICVESLMMEKRKGRRGKKLEKVGVEQGATRRRKSNIGVKSEVSSSGVSKGSVYDLVASSSEVTDGKQLNTFAK